MDMSVTVFWSIIGILILFIGMVIIMLYKWHMDDIRMEEERRLYHDQQKKAFEIANKNIESISSILFDLIEEKDVDIVDLTGTIGINTYVLPDNGVLIYKAGKYSDLYWNLRNPVLPFIRYANGNTIDNLSMIKKKLKSFE